VLAPFFKGGNTSSGSRLSRVDVGKWAPGKVEWSVLAPFFKGGNTSSESWLKRINAGKWAPVIVEPALESRRRQSTLSRLQERFLLVSKPLQWRIKWFWRQTKGIRMDNGG
jgi:hypothetical protein